VFAADVLSSMCRVQETHWRAVGHHDIYGWEIRNRVLGNRFGVWRALMRRIISVFISEIREGPVAELRLIRRRVDLAQSVRVQ
jgi:hypothetical protein